jgi:hypothetical protein
MIPPNSSQFCASLVPVREAPDRVGLYNVFATMSCLFLVQKSGRDTPCTASLQVRNVSPSHASPTQ